MFEINLTGFFIAVGFTLILTPFIIKLAAKIGAIDNPGQRKIHKHPIPRLGGAGIFLSFILALIIVHYLFPRVDIFYKNNNINLILPVVSLLLILSLGIYDDIKSLKPGIKFFIQLSAASLIYLSGFQISTITNPFSGELIEFGIFSYPLTILWITGITNAFNLIDGLDGLAAGIAIIASFTIFTISVLHNDITSALLTIILAGSLSGFLFFNFNPAKIFLGDSGSLFAGFFLAVLSVQTSTKGSTAFSMIIALLALGVPVIDTLMAMIRRLLAWFLPNKSKVCSFTQKLHSMFLPDRRHVHHMLLEAGFTHRGAVLVLYFVSVLMGSAAVLVTAGSVNSSWILGMLVVLIILTVRKLNYNEMALLRNGILLKLYNFAFLKNSVLQICADAFSVFTAFFLSYIFTVSADTVKIFNTGFLFTAVIILIIQLIVFLIGGLYKRKINLLGLGDLLHILKVVVAAVLIAAVLLHSVSVHSLNFQLSGMLLYFYFLTTLVAGSRILFHALNYIFNKGKDGKKRILIYGADWKGMLVLQALLQSDNNKYPAGFLDDDPELEGKFINGYPIFGGHWKLESLVKKGLVNEIIMAGGETSYEIFKRIKSVSLKFGVPVQVSRINFETLNKKHQSKNQKNIIKERQVLVHKTI